MLVAAIAAAPLAALPVATATAQQVTSPSQDIVLPIGKGQLVSVPGTMSDVFVADENVADVQINSQRQLYVFGKAGGETTIYASNARGDVIFSANIRVGSNIGSIDQMMALAMPDAKINVSTMGTSTVLLTATVAAPEDAAEAERLVQAFLGENANVITRLKTATPLQVNLQVKFAEVSRRLLREVGGNLQMAHATGGFRFGVGKGRAISGPNGQAFSYGGPLGVGNNVAQTSITLPDGTQLVGPSVNSAGGTSLAGRYGLIVKGSAPTTPGALAPGQVRIVISRSTAYVPGCPDWSAKSDMNYSNGLSPNHGCANNSNLAAMVADPQDLLEGRKGSSETLINTSNKAISTFRDATPTGAGGLMDASAGGGNGGGN